MGMLLLDRAKLEITTEGETLVLYEAGERRGTIPIRLINHCVIQGTQTRLDSSVLMKLAEAGVCTVIMSPRQARRVAIVLGAQHNDATVRLAQAARVMDADYCQRWALSIVNAKLARQARTLQHWLIQRPDARKPLFDARQTIHSIMQTLQSATQPYMTPGIDSLRGHEGAAARAYFAALSAVLPPVLGFTGRNRRPPRDPVNVCLSLGYTLLHSQAVTACQSTGLDPLLGFYHRPAFGRESLASDLIEPLRPALDLWVWELLRSRTLREEHFSMDKGACLLGKAGRSVYYADWAQASKPWQRWLRERCRLLARDMRNQGQQWIETEDPEAGEDCETC